MMGGSTGGDTFLEHFYACFTMMTTVAVFATILGTIGIILDEN